MTSCPLCDATLPLALTRGPLSVMHQPRSLFYRGLRVPMDPIKIRMIDLLLRFGRINSTALEMLMGDDTECRALAVHMSQIRSRFREHNVDVEIKNIRGWGYEIKVKS